jgi:hypothetical protein
MNDGKIGAEIDHPGAQANKNIKPVPQASAAYSAQFRFVGIAVSQFKSHVRWCGIVISNQFLYHQSGYAAFLN